MSTPTTSLSATAAIAATTTTARAGADPDASSALPELRSRAAAAPSRWRRVASEFAESRLALAGLLLFALILLGALAAPWIAPQNPYDLGALDVMDGKLPPGSLAGDGSMTYWLGTDGQARDMFSAILYGLRISLLVGFVSVAIAFALGALAGIVAAYRGGWVDALIMRIVDVQLALPAVLIALVLLSVLGKGVEKIIFALVLVQWAYFARTARAAAVVERQKEYMEAAQCLALGRWRSLWVHLLPNCMPPLIALASIDVAVCIAAEATLSFLGVGVPVSEPSLGMLTANGFDYLMSGRYWISFFPGAALALTIVSLNLVGDQLREVLNPRNAQ
jgi:peptide/nickel transport system permease protein